MKRFGIGVKQAVVAVVLAVGLLTLSGVARADDGDRADYSLVGVWRSQTVGDDGQAYVVSLVFDDDGNVAMARCAVGTVDVQEVQGTYVYGNGVVVASFAGQVQVYRLTWIGRDQFVNGDEVWNRV